MGERQHRGRLRFRGGGGRLRYDSIENCAVNKLVGLSCFPRPQPPGAFVCLSVCLLLHCSASINAGLSVVSGQPKWQRCWQERGVVDGWGVNKRSQNHRSSAFLPFPLLPCQPVWTAPRRSNLFVISLFLFMSVCLQPDHIAAVRSLTALSVVHVFLY